MRIWTIEEIRKGSRIEIEYRVGNEKAGGLFRRISSYEYLKHMPAPLEDIEGEPALARTARVEEWSKIHADAIAEGDVQLVALASVDPKLTVDDVRALGNEAATIRAAIIAFTWPPAAEEPPAGAP